uniref:Serine/threonine-protein kinase MAK n=1 Tax=Ganoderma boninense TaxID=34458 RepID=A0A5K1K5A6_9APHY|nr:Serine/threonine-protein kinase MAK [Ganoderma boninense]
MASGMDIWGAIASAIGVLTTIQIIIIIINSRLPSKRIRLFERTLKDTEDLLQSVAEEGLFNDNGHYVAHTKIRISNICTRLQELRQESFTAKTYSQELKQWWWGLSAQIIVCDNELKELRAEISVTSTEARLALARQREAALRDGMASATLDDGSSQAPAAEPVPGGGSCDSGSAEEAPLTDSRPDSATLPEQFEQERPQAIHTDGCEDSAVATEGPIDNDVYDADGTKLANCCVQGPPQRPTRSDSADTLPPYCQQGSVFPPYPPCASPACSADSTSPLESVETPVMRTTVLLARCTAADSARTRKLIKAHRRTLMVHNVPWKPQSAPHLLHGNSAAASAIAADRPSNNTRHWKLLEERSRAPLRSYIAVLSHEAIIDTAPHATSSGQA